MKIKAINIGLLVISSTLLLPSCAEKTADSEQNGKNSSTESANTKTYNSTVIGEQTWMTENLDITVFNNGDEIPQAVSEEDWKAAVANKTPAWCYYNNDQAMGEKYGKLYNWYAVTDARGFCPEGWHLPSNGEINILKSTCGDDNAAIGLKSKDGWKDKDGYPHTNEFGFNGLPAGVRRDFGNFLYESELTGYWGGDELNADQAFYFGLNYDYSFIYGGSTNKGTGYSVRCIKD